MYKISVNARKTKPSRPHNSISNTGNMEGDFRTLLLTYMYTNLSEETKVLSNKIAFAHEKNQSNEKSKQSEA